MSCIDSDRPELVRLVLSAEEKRKLHDLQYQTRAAVAGHAKGEKCKGVQVIDCEQIYVRHHDWEVCLDSDTLFDAAMRYSQKALELMHGVGHEIEQQVLQELGMVILLIPEKNIAVLGSPWHGPITGHVEPRVVIGSPPPRDIPHPYGSTVKRRPTFGRFKKLRK